MTYVEVIVFLNGKTFYSESFGGEEVTVYGTTVIGKSGLTNTISTKRDVHDLFTDYRKDRSCNVTGSTQTRE